MPVVNKPVGKQRVVHLLQTPKESWTPSLKICFSQIQSTAVKTRAGGRNVQPVTQRGRIRHSEGPVQPLALQTSVNPASLFGYEWKRTDIPFSYLIFLKTERIKENLYKNSAKRHRVKEAPQECNKIE